MGENSITYNNLEMKMLLLMRMDGDRQRNTSGDIDIVPRRHYCMMKKDEASLLRSGYCSHFEEFTDGRTDKPTDGPTRQVLESHVSHYKYI